MIEKSVKLFLAVLTASAAFCLDGAEDLPVFDKIKVKVALQDPPRVKLTANASTAGRLSQTNRSWAVIHVEFTPRLGEKENLARKNTGAWLDDVTMALQVILADSSLKKAAGYALFDGRCDFWTISLDNRPHSAYMFIAPQLLERYLPSRKSSGMVRAAQTSDFKVRVIFFHKKFGVIGEGYSGQNNSSKAKLRAEFVYMRESVGSRNTLNGALLTRMRTPWGMSDMGRFDLVKPEVIPPALNEEALEKAAQEAEEKSRKESEQQKKNSVRHSSSKRKTR